jgi:hypothetical protein
MLPKSQNSSIHLLAFVVVPFPDGYIVQHYLYNYKVGEYIFVEDMLDMWDIDYTYNLDCFQYFGDIVIVVDKLHAFLHFHLMVGLWEYLHVVGHYIYKDYMEVV